VRWGVVEREANLKDSYLVTGGSGLIGSYVAKALVERGENVVVFDVKPPSNPKIRWVLEPVWEKIAFVEGSVSDDFPSLLKACKDYDVEKIFHAAAIFRGPYEQQHPYYSLHVSIEGMLNICEAARILNLGRIVFAGTNVEYIHLYKDQSAEPLTENDRIMDPTSGASTYAAGKMASTIIGMCYWQNQGVDWVSTRFTRVWGFGSKRETSRNELIIENAIDGIPTTIPREGDQKRNQCYVKDLVQGIILALDTDGNKLQQRIFNLGGPDELSDREIVAVVKEIIPQAEIDVVGGGVDRRLIDSTAAKEQLGWEHKWEFRRAVKDYVENYKKFKEKM